MNNLVSNFETRADECQDIDDGTTANDWAIYVVTCADHDYVYVEDGCLSEQGVFDDHDHDCYSTNSTATVRCCSDNGEYCDSEDTNGTCFSSASTYAEAVVECEAAGMRLCAYDELVASEDDCSQDGGYW